MTNPVLDEHSAVAESAVVGFPHSVKGEALYAFVILKEGAQVNEEELKKELSHQVRHRIAAFAVPDAIQVCQGLPKTRSGKIMRRILRKIAAGQTDLSQFGDISTLAEPDVVEQLIREKTP